MCQFYVHQLVVCQREFNENDLTNDCLIILKIFSSNSR